MRIFIYLTILSFPLISCSKQKAAKPTGEPITLSVNYSEGDSKIITAQMDMEMEMCQWRCGGGRRAGGGHADEQGRD